MGPASQPCQLPSSPEEAAGADGERCCGHAGRVTFHQGRVMLILELEGFVEVFPLKTAHLQKASIKRLLGTPGMDTSGRRNHMHEYVERARFMDVNN